LTLAFFIFLLLALKELRNSGISAVRQIKFQLAVATLIWLIGESLYYAPEHISSIQLMVIHTMSMAIFALIVITRLPKILGN